MRPIPHFHAHFLFDEALAHRVYAAADAICIPSLFEPCGLSQLIALRYGTLPIARKTGGLADTVFEGKSGFLFEEPTTDALEHTLQRVFLTYRKQPDTWLKMVHHGLQLDFSWDRSTKEYLKLYSN